MADSSIIAAVNGAAVGSGPLATIIVKDRGSARAVRRVTAQPDATPPVAGFTNPEILNGPMYTTAGDEQSPLFEVRGTLAGGYTIHLASGNNDDLTSDSYSFQVRIILDEDGVPGDDNVLERDITLTADVTINVMRVDKNDLHFDVDPGKAIKGATASGLRRPIDSNPLEWIVTGIGSSAKLLDIGSDGVVGDFQVKESPAGSGKFRLFVVNSGAGALGATTAPINLALTYDEDTATDSDGQGDKDDDADVTIDITGDITSRSPLTFTRAPNAAGIHFAFTIPQSISADTPVGFFGVEGGIDAVGDSAAEYLDGIVSGPDSGPFGVRDSDMTLVYKGSPALEVKIYTLDLTVNGDAGMANRAIIGKATVTVTASNQAPTAPPSFAATVEEDDPSVAGLVKADTEVGDASADVTSPDGDSLTYTTQGNGASVFDIDDAGMITVGSDGISASAGGPDDDPDTDDEDAKYTRSDNGVLADDTAKFSDITYTFQIKVSDGVSANDKYISATVTVDVNEPTEVAEALPSGVMTATLMIDDDGDDETPDVEAENGYSITVSVPERDVPMTLFNLGDLVSDADSNDDLSFDVSGSPSHIVYDMATDNVLLTYLPPESDPGPRVDTIKVGVSDGVNGEDDDDLTLYIEISITEEQPEPITSEFVGITVAENSTDCMQDGSMGCSLAGEVPNAVSYSIESGVDGGDVDYVIDSSTGVITVVKAPNFEDGKTPAFLVNAQNDIGDLAGLISVRVSITDVPEAPTLTAITGVPWVYETAQIGDDVVEKPADQDGPAATDEAISIAASDPDAGATITYTISEGKPPFAVDASTGALTVNGALDKEAAASHTFKVKASDEGGLSDEMEITVHVLNANETPEFTSPTGDGAVTTIPENTGNAHVIFTFTATDQDGDDLAFTLREGQSRDLFVIENAKSEMVSGEEVWSGELHVKTDVTLDFEDAGYDPRVHVEANDPEGLNATLLLTVNLSNVNDNDPEFDESPALTLSVAENTARDYVLSNYSASDADGDVDGDGVVVSYSLRGEDAKSFSISDTGDLQTLESLDADNAMTPCGSDGCSVMVAASDGERETTASVRITVTGVEDSVSTLGVSKANPVPGTTMGNAMSALSNTKTSASAAVPERPADLPATYGDEPMNFVATEWGNWGTVLRIAVTSESPDPNCGNGNQCVIVDINSDSADDALKLQAYRSADQENKFVAAVMLVETTDEATAGDDAVYTHNGGGVPAIRVDEEDEIEVEFGNLRDSIDVENEAPEIGNFAPEHESAFSDADVDYTFTVTDAHSGIPEPEDLPDVDGDDNYTPAVALISRSQCETVADGTTPDDKTLSFAASIHEDETLYCPGTMQEGEYIATGTGFGFAPIRDDKDFDEIDDGYDVETTLVLDENRIFYVTFIACDNAGNCTFYDPDGNDDSEELAEITVDTEDPVFVEARTGLTWDSTDNEYDDNRSFIQVIFDDLTTLNPSTVETDDFVVEGHSIKDVHTFENPDSDDVNWGDSGRYVLKAPTGANGKKNLYQDIENSVFVELEDELLADETPDVTIVPNGVEDGAGNDQDDGDHEADDWISPKFTIVSITSTLETSQDEVLAGDGDEVTVVVTADERLDATRPTVVVTYVNAAAGSVDTKGTASCHDGTDDGGTRDRGEIVNNDYCQHSGAATGGNLNNSVEKVSNTEWIVTITEPKDTGYYNFRIEGVDRSPQENPGSEGVAAASIVTDFFDSDGDVNADDAVFFEGDINLAKPNVRVSGMMITDNEPSVEYRSPLFVEIDFTIDHMGSSDCNPAREDRDHLMANCENENSEYAEDNFDDIVVTMFELDGVDMTDSVKTTDTQTFLVTLESVALGDHTAKIQAMDVAGNVLEDVLEIDFEVSDRDPFDKRLSPGWNLVSLPGEPADSSIAAVFGPGVEVRTVYTYDPVIPGGWMVAVRETLDSDWQGDLTEITGMRGYWVLSDAIQDWEVSIPRLAGGAAGTGTPIQPPVIPLYAGWNLIPVTDVKGNALSAGVTVSAMTYLQSLESGVEPARVLGFDTIRNEWYTVLDGDMTGPGMGTNLEIGSAYWVFVREATSLVPGGAAGGGSGD